MVFKTAGQEIKVFPAEFKAKAGGANDGLTIEGYASTFTDNPDCYGDVVRRGAFKKTIRQRFTEKIKQGKFSDIVILWQHRDPFGMPVKLGEDAKGLYFEGEITNTPFGREQMEYIRHGVVKQASFGFDTLQFNMGKEDDDFARELITLKLYELSPVTFGANEETETEAKRLLQLIGEKIKPFEHLLIPGSQRIKAVVSFQDWSIAPRDRTFSSDTPPATPGATDDNIENRVRAWASRDGSGDADQMDWKKYRTAHLWFDGENQEAFGGYKLKIVDVVDGKPKAVPRGIFRAAGIIQGARGGIDISEADKDKVRNHLNRYYAAMRKEFDDDTIIAPWLKSVSKYNQDEIEGLKAASDHWQTTELRASHVLPSANIKIINNALESISQCDLAFKALLKAAESADSTSDGKSESDKAISGSEGESPDFGKLMERIKNITV